MPQPNLRPKYLRGPPILGGPYCCYNTNLKVVMVGANGRGFGWLCDLPLLSVRDRIHPGPTPRMRNRPPHSVVPLLRRGSVQAHCSMQRLLQRAICGLQRR